MRLALMQLRRAVRVSAVGVARVVCLQLAYRRHHTSGARGFAFLVSTPCHVKTV